MQTGPPQPGRRARWRNVLLAAIGGLYVASIPWYRAPGERPQLWLGLPDWAALAIACYAGVAVLNALAWLLSEVRDPGDDG